VHGVLDLSLPDQVMSRALLTGTFVKESNGGISFINQYYYGTF